MKPLPEKYDHKAAERKWQQHWETARTYAWDSSQPRANTYVIDTPPPTVSGLLHMGHVFSYTHADFVARYQRMSGKTVFYPMGFDDNGLPTERLVEKAKKIRATDMSREDFIKVCQEVVKEAEEEFRAMFRSIAVSVDWAQEYQTVSAESRRISQMSFLDLHRKGAAYRQLQPMLWDPVDQTALAQAEVEDKEMPSHMNHIRFDVEGEAESSLSPRERDGVRAYPPKQLVANARELRKNTTDVEKILWHCLRDRQLGEYKFRRQHPVEPYVADFACVEAKLIVELDGGQHAEDAARHKDQKRAAFLESKGFTVLRFWNNDVLDNLEGVLETLLSALAERCPHPTPLPEGEGIVIATTRPELIPACVGIFYHPDDARYAHLKGKHAITPLFGVKVPILSDDSVEMEKGTGIMMCCTFGDEADIAKWRKHKLPTHVILNKFGKLDAQLLVRAVNDRGGNASAAELVANLKTSNPDPKHPGARQKILTMLQDAGLLLKQDTITHTVKCAERSGAPLELIPTPQWFVKVLDKKDELKAKAAECVWYPAWMETRMVQWIDGLNWDWCISRQRYFGVPFPVWYSKRAGEEGKVLVAEPDQLPVNPLTDLPKGYTRDEVDPDMDVMDTWATSSVSPQLSSKAINKDLEVDYARHQQLFPADLRPQAHEIIRTWAFYTLVKSYYHENSIPWKNLMISGWCLASDKTKMSKSKGNVVTPVALIEEKGSDAVRFWASTAKLGTDTAFSEDVLKIGNKLVNKLWNAAKFSSLHFDKLAANPTTAKADIEAGVITDALDRWILSRLNKAIKNAAEEFEKYDYSAARQAAEDFFWNDFCDNYLELSKARAYDEKGDNKKGQRSAIHTLYHCLEAVLKLFAPFVPHITDELYSHIFDDRYARTNSIHARGTWPVAANYPTDDTAEASGIACVSALNAIRKLKSEKGVSIKTPLERVEVGAGTAKGEWKTLEPTLTDLKNAGNAMDIAWNNTPASPTTDSEDGLYRISATFAEKEDAA